MPADVVVNPVLVPPSGTWTVIVQVAQIVAALGTIGAVIFAARTARAAAASAGATQVAQQQASESLAAQGRAALRITAKPVDPLADPTELMVSVHNDHQINAARNLRLHLHDGGGGPTYYDSDDQWHGRKTVLPREGIVVRTKAVPRISRDDDDTEGGLGTEAVLGEVAFDDDQQIGRWRQEFVISESLAVDNYGRPQVSYVCSPLRFPQRMGNIRSPQNVGERLKLALKVARGRQEVEG